MSTPPDQPSVQRFIEHALASLRDRTFVRLLLSQPLGADNSAASNVTSPVERVIARLVEIRGAPMLSLTLREATRDTTRNIAIDDIATWLAESVAVKFRSAVLETTQKNWQLTVSAKGRTQLVAHRATHVEAPSRTHDEAKPTLLGPMARPWLTQLAVYDADGRVRASMAAKHRQLERYLEILAHLARDCGWKSGDSLSVADMGAGKGYLTFGAWHLLNNILGLHAEVIGVETRADLVAQTNAVARAVGADGLRFVEGNIASAELPPLDVLIALHACDTATDDAIRRGIAARARLIVVSPCCHQELRPQLGRPVPLAPVLAHGIFAERMSEWLTDGLRMLHLERAGYATKAIEFVASEHTPRNLLLAGVRRDRDDASGRERATAEIVRLKDFFGIGHHALDGLLEG